MPGTTREPHPRTHTSRGNAFVYWFRIRERGGDGVSGRDLAHHTEFDRLVTDAAVTDKRQGVIVLVKEDFDRDAGGISLAFGTVGAAVGAEGALADREVSGVADDRELDWCHAPLLVPDMISLSSGRHSLRLKSKFDASFWRDFA